MLLPPVLMGFQKRLARLDGRRGMLFYWKSNAVIAVFPQLETLTFVFADNFRALRFA